jgi:hypothetical protein
MNRVYSYSAYDKYLALKIDFKLWLVIVYLLRPVLVKLAGFRSRGEAAEGARKVMDMLYPDDFSLFIALVVTIPTVLVLFAYAKRKPGASSFIRRIWSNGAILLMVTAGLNMATIVLPLIMGSIHHLGVYGWGQLAVAVFIFWYLFASRRVKDTFADFPVEAELENGIGR